MPPSAVIYVHSDDGFDRRQMATCAKAADAAGLSVRLIACGGQEALLDAVEVIERGDAGTLLVARPDVLGDQAEAVRDLVAYAGGTLVVVKPLAAGPVKGTLLAVPGAAAVAALWRRVDAGQMAGGVAAVVAVLMLVTAGAPGVPAPQVEPPVTAPSPPPSPEPPTVPPAPGRPAAGDPPDMGPEPPPGATRPGRPDRPPREPPTTTKPAGDTACLDLLPLPPQVNLDRCVDGLRIARRARRSSFVLTEPHPTLILYVQNR